MDNSGTSLDAVVVGAGPNGLAAAVRLAQSGCSVGLYEANATVGGGARTTELTLPGFKHDVCSAVHPMSVASPFFRSLPLHEHGLEWLHPPRPLAHPFDDGTAATLERSVESTGESFQSDRDARRYRQVVQPLVESWDSLAAELLGPIHVPHSPLLLARFGWWAARSGVGTARALFQSKMARAWYGGLAAHSVLPLERPPSSAVALVLALAGHVFGWPSPRGGAQAIADALASYFRSLGGTIITSHPVRSIDELPKAKVYLFDVSPLQLLSIAGNHLPPRYRRTLGRYRYGPGVFKVDWALDGPIPWKAEACRGAGALHLGGTLDELAESERACWENRHIDRPYVLLAQPSVFDPSRAPEGKHVGWAYCHVPNGSTTDMSEAIEGQVERFAPGFRDRILARHTMNCSQMQASNANYIGGDIIGGVTDIAQLLARPSLSMNPYATPNPQIYLCSASTPPGAGVHGMCGYNAAVAAISKLK